MKKGKRFLLTRPLIAIVLSLALIPAFFCIRSYADKLPEPLVKDGCEFDAYDDGNDGNLDSIILTSLTDASKTVREFVLPSAVTYEGKDYPQANGETDSPGSI